ncbi:hypothetical protein [Anaeromyxobacter oryzae]|uniref:Lipoprotein n=1 Tax=Anaeromyxobacter oryzae TaxID=2918170 RepID=A0ABM7X4C2_9BACT|nr:hypothetical protein [Anaeromyxobacter oryzae]BDG06650.1 hypothetical protein AMOR_56460 [Anaeromyxobacter oryzae]
MRRARISALFLPAFCGCGLFLSQSTGKDANGFYVYPQQQAPPHALLVEGEIRDSLSFRAEPRAVIETRTDDPDYAPKATIDERGQFSLRIDVCRREATAGEEFVSELLIGSSDGCARWLGQFHFRARLGDRCSLSYGEDTLPKEHGPLVLWLRPCTEAESLKRPQRGER